MEVAATAVSIDQVTFAYTKEEPPILKNISFLINEGERFGLFGPNGAGKTTLMQLITGLLTPVNGDVTILSRNYKQHKRYIRQYIGFVPQDFSFYHELTPVENLAFFGAWYGMSTQQIKNQSDKLLDVLGLSNVAHKQVHKFSGGMKRRVNLAIGVMHNPKLLILDEPTVGVDVQTRNSIIEFLFQLNKTGTTLVYTSHQLNEAEELCDKIALMDQGKIIALSTLQALKEKYQQTGLEGLFLNLTGKAYRDA